MSTLKLENIKHENSSSNNLVLDSDGSVTVGKLGIGTSSPSAPLEIIHGASSVGLHTKGSYNWQAKFESTDAEAAIVIEDSNSIDNGNRIGVITNDMTFITANTERMRIDASGRVTKPNHPAFLAVGNAGQTSYSAGAIILIVNQQFDKNNNFNTTNGRFTAPVDGVYMFTYGFYSYEASKQFAIKVNNSDYAPSDTCGLVDAKNTSDMCNGSLVLDLSANDYVNVGYRSGLSGSVYLNHCWFGGHLVG